MNHDKAVILSAKNIKKSFTTPKGEVVILDEASFEVRQGEKVAIVGPSGSGKSTLLSLLGLLDTPDAGEILINQINTKPLKQDELAKLRSEEIGFVFQNFELITPFTVRENVTAALDIAGKSADGAKISALINEVGLSAREEAMPATLSGGEKQRVAIARALANDPAIILADEPTGSLDRATGEKVLQMLLEAVSLHGKTLVVITHDQTLASKMDRVYEVRDKKLHERI